MKAVAKDIYYVGVNDRQKALFENLWPLPGGVSYNSYLIVDDKTVLVDTVDICYSDLFFKRVAKLLNGRKLDYLVVDHMEPDHAGSIRLLRQIYPDVKIIGNKQTFGMLAGYHGITDGLHEVKEGDTLDLGHHKLSFYMAPMVHWPEVMVTYEETEKVLFSADAFGTFGTLDGGVLDTDMDTDRFWSEMTRYYANIVGKYGGPVQRALKKLSGLDIQTICSTHGPVWTRQSGDVIAKEMAHADDGKGKAKNDHEIRELRNALVLAYIFFDGMLERINSAGIRFQPAVNAVGLLRHEQQADHPQLRNHYINHDHRAEERVIDMIELLHRGLVRTTADPAAGDRGKAFPQITRHPFWVNHMEQPDSKWAAENHTDGCGEKHGKCLPAQADNFL